MALSILLLTLTACSPWEQSPVEDLAALTSEEASARELATRRLCGRLPVEHYEALLELAVGADHELERRITRVIAAREERLSLAVELMSSPDGRARTIGRSAFLELLLRWNPSYDDTPLPSYKARQLLRGSQVGLFSVPRCEGASVPFLERLAEGADFGVPVVLDPGLELRFGASLEAAGGSPLDHLERICLRDGLTYELRGPESGDGVIHRGLGHWLRVCAGRVATGEPTREVMIRWALEVAQGGEDALSAARALATTGWPAPLAWFEERWRTGRDPVAFSGLIAAAARGRVPLVLNEAETHLEARELLDRVAGRTSEPGASWQVERIARGMAQAGAHASQGEDPSGVWSEEEEGLSALSIWARLLVLEGHRRGDVSLAREVLKRGASVDLALWRQALRAYISDPDRRPLELSMKELGPALREGHKDGLARNLFMAGVRAKDLSDSHGVDLLKAELSLRAFEGGAFAATLLGAWRSEPRGSTEVEELLSRWCSEFGRGRVARGLVDLTLEEGERQSWERLLELAGVLAPGASGESGDDLQRIACCAGQTDGALVRGLLLEELGELDPVDTLRVKEFKEAWRRVGWALQEAGEERLLLTFAAQTRLLITEPEAQEELLGGFPPTPRGLSAPMDVGLLRSEGLR